MKTVSSFSQQSWRFRTMLKANAIFSGFAGLTFGIFFEEIANEIGMMHSWILPILGIGLMCFAITLLVIAKKAVIPKTLAYSIIGSDAAWVLTSLLLLAWFPDYLYTTGNWLVFVIAIIVSCFAVMQYQTYKQEHIA